MEKDIFNGNVKKEFIGYMKTNLGFMASAFFALFVFFLLTALLYEKIEYAARIAMFILAGGCFLASVLYPAVSIYAIRNYAKHPKLAKAMVKPFVLRQFDLESKK